MHTPRFFFAGDLKPQAVVTLTATASHHLLNVLRIKPGEKIILFNGQGGEYITRYQASVKKLAQVEILTHETVERESPIHIELGQAISRSEKMDYAIQKAVELGANQITPLITERCALKLKPEKFSNRMSHWEGIVLNAAEQSGRLQLPTVTTPSTLQNWLAQKREGLCLVCDPNASTALKDFPKPQQVTLLIGPESGLSDSEIEAAKKSGFQPISLGPRILRTETATVAALTLIQNHFGDI